MDFSTFLSLHRSIETASTNTLISVLKSLDTQCIKQLLLIYCKFFFDLKNRNKYINDDSHPTNHLHLNIIHNIRKKTKFGHSETDEVLNKFNKLPELLTSHILSFLDHRSRLRASTTNHSLFKASNQSISKYHFKINQLFIEKKLCLKHNGFDTNYFQNMRSLSFSSTRCTKKGGKKKQKIFLSNLSKILKLPTLKHLNLGWCPINDIFNDSNMNIESLSFYGVPSKNLVLNQVKNVKYVHISGSYQYVNKIQFLWIKQQNISNSSSIIDLSDGDLSINKYIINHSKLEHIELRLYSVYGISCDLKCDKTIRPHPLFWLWNIPNLKSCKLNVTLPKSKHFKKECSKLLSSSIIVNKSQKQTKFNQLSLEINLYHRSIEGKKDEVLCEDLNVFLKYLSKMYPNLTSIQYGSSLFYHTLYSHKLDWNMIFKNMSEIKIEISSIEIASDFLLYLTNHHHFIKVCHLNGIIPTKTLHHDGYEYYDSMHGFIDNICNYIRNRADSLYSFSIKVEGEGLLYNNLKDDYFGAYQKYLNCLLNRIETNNNDIFNGYLKLELPAIHIFRNTNNPRFHKWGKDNIQCSLKISQIICKMQTVINEYNINNPHNMKKTILYLEELTLFSEHIKFLKFWFNDDENLYENNKFVMF